MSDMKKIRIVGRGFEGFTGQFGMYQFEGGVSVEYLNRAERDRMAAAVPCVEIDEDGAEQDAGTAARLLRDAGNVEEPKPGLARQTEEERQREVSDVAKSKFPDRKLRTREQLEAIADRGGIADLRKIADRWDVRDRSIPALIEKILAAQDRWQRQRDTAMERAGVVNQTGEPAVTETTETTETTVDQSVKTQES